MAPSCGCDWSTPETLTVEKSIPRGPEKPPPPPGPKPPPGACVCAGTVPVMCTALSVSPLTAPWTFASERIVETFVAGKLSCEVELNESREKWVPGLSFVKSSRPPPFSCCSSFRSVAESPRKPPELFEICSGRVTDMSVPTPVSGCSTWA